MNKIADAIQTLKEAIHADPDYAWTWHCNLAMPMCDQGWDFKNAHLAAARQMQLLFNYDSTTNNLWGSTVASWTNVPTPPMKKSDEETY